MALLKSGIRIIDNLFNNKRLSNITVYGNFAYIIDSSNSQILKKDLATLESSILLTFTGEVVRNIATDGINMYLSTVSNKIYRISLSNPTLYLFSSNQQLQGPGGLWIDSINNHIYVLNINNGTISQLDLTTGNPTDLPWLTGLNYPNNIIGYNNYLYVSNSDNTAIQNISRTNTISKISLTTKTIETFIDSTYLSSPSYLAIYQDYLYVCNNSFRNGENIILSINLTGDPIISRAYMTIYSPFTGISVYNNNICSISAFSNDGINQHIFASNEPPPLALVNNLSLTNSSINNYRLRPAITYGDFAYISDASTNSILKMDLLTNTINTWFGTTSQPLALATNGTYIYFSRNGANIIYRIPLSSNPTDTLASYQWSTSSQLNNPSGLDINSNYLYVSNRTSGGNGTISEIDLTTGLTTSDSAWISGLYQPTRMKIYNGNLYVINSFFSTGTINTSMANTVSKISLTTKTIERFVDSTNINVPYALDIYNDYLYVNNNSPNFHGIYYTTRINLTGPPIITYGVSSITQSNMSQSYPLGIFTYNNSIYMTTQKNGPNNTAINNINIYKEVSSLTPIPKNVSYDSNTKILSWTPTGSYNSFIIHELENNYIITTNDVSFNFTTLLSQNSFITSLNFVVRQVTSGAIGPESNRYRINLLKPTNLSYDKYLKILSWTGSSQRDYYIIRDLSKNLELYSRSANNINLSSFLSQNPSIFLLNITVQDVTNGVIGPASIPYTIDLTPSPTGILYTPNTKVLSWIATSPYDYFIIQDLSKGLDVTSNDISFNLSSFLSLNPSIKFLNITVKQVTNGMMGSTNFSINLAQVTDIRFDITTKILSWNASQYDSFNITLITIPNNIITSFTTNDTSYNFTTYISQNPTITLSNVIISQINSGIRSNSNSPYTISFLPLPTGLSYNPTTKVLSWIGTLPYDSFLIEEPAKGMLIGNSNITSFDLTTYISQNPTFTILNITVKQVSSGFLSNEASIIINLELPQSNICFVEGTIIKTDQGEIPIEIVTNKNTIDNLKVLEVTKTISMEDELICIEKDCFGLNSPNKKTVVSQNHTFLFNGHLVKAKNLNNVSKLPYNGEILYNVLLETNSFMIANNLVCETLDVDNVIAHLYRSPNKIEITKLLNTAKDFDEYKQIALTYL